MSSKGRGKGGGGGEQLLRNDESHFAGNIGRPRGMVRDNRGCMGYSSPLPFTPSSTPFLGGFARVDASSSTPRIV